MPDNRVKDLACGPFREVHTWPQYNVNGYKFHTETYGSNKSTMNSGVCIKGTNYAEFESDYYGILTDIIELEYPNPTTKRTRVVLFKCDWFDPTINQGCKIHEQYGLVEINFKRKFDKYEPFILASQSQQVYFAEYPVEKEDKAKKGKVKKVKAKKDKGDWRAVCKIEARSIIHSPDLPYQEDEMPIVVEPTINDELQCLTVIDGEDEDQEIVDDEVDGEEIEESDVETQTEDAKEDEDDTNEDDSDENEDHIEVDVDTDEE